MSRITSEFLGTFLLCCFVLLGGRFGMALGLAALLWSLGAPGVTLNPAAGLALALRGRLGWTTWIGLALVQFAAAVAAAALTGLIAGHNAERLAADSGGPPDAWLAALVSEGLATFAFILVFLAAFASRRLAGSSLAPFAVGALAFALHEAFSRPVAFMNPALVAAWGFHDLVSALRAEEPGSALVGELARFGRFVPWAALLVAPQVAAAFAGWAAFRLTHPEDRAP